MHCWEDSSGMPLSSIIMVHLMASMLSEWVSLMISFSLEKRKVTEQDQVKREVVPVQQHSSWPRSAGCLGCREQMHCCGQAATICPTLTLVSSHTMIKAYTTGSPWRLSDPVARNHHRWRIWSTLSCVLSFQWCWRLPLTTQMLGFQFILKNPGHHYEESLF